MSQKKKKKTKAKPKPANKTLPPNIGKAPARGTVRKSKERTYAEIAGWSVLVFLLYVGYRVIALYGLNIGEFLTQFTKHTALHAPDYSMGFLPRVLSGQILSFFAEPPFTRETMAAYLIIVYVIAYGLFSVIIGAMIEKALRTKNYLMALFPLLFILAPASVWFRSFSIIQYDSFLLIFALCAFLSVKNEKLMWFVPVTLFFGIATNYAHVLLFFPLIFALLYYEYINSGRKRVRLIHLIVTTISSAALELYMLWAPFHSGQLAKYSYEDSLMYLERKIGRALNSFELWYISTSIFGKNSAGASISRELHYSWLQDWWLQPKFFLIAVLVCVPVLIFTFAIWRKLAKGEKGFLKKSPYFLFMLAPLIIFPEFLIFMDIDRLVWAALLTQVLLVVYVFLSNGQHPAFAPPAEGKRRWIMYVMLALCIIIPMIVFRETRLMNPPSYKPDPFF